MALTPAATLAIARGEGDEAICNELANIGAVITALATGRLLREPQIFTASGTWTKPTNCVAVWVEVWGPGGSGASSQGGPGTCSAGGGGGSGGYASEWIDAPGATETVTVGTGGAAPAAGNNNGNAGSGSSSFGSGPYLQATAGGGGTAQATGITSVFTAAGAAGLGSGGDVNLAGRPATPGQRISGTVGRSGDGGSAPLGGGGGKGNLTHLAGNVGTGPGAGGSGALSIGAGDLSGAAGKDGMVRVWEFS